MARPEPESPTPNDATAIPDELGVKLLCEICSEYGIPWPWQGSPAVKRQAFELRDGQVLSGLKWGTEAPELVLLHGGRQSAHAWDAVALALDRPLLALDLPSHGHSDATKDGVHDPATLAATIAEVMDQVAPSAEAVCGASLGGLAGISLCASRPDLVRRLVLVDVTPGITTKRPAQSAETEAGDHSFASFAVLLQRLRESQPTRSEASLRRSILFNAMQTMDGSWIWRHDRHPRRHPRRSAFDQLWSQLDSVRAPTMLVRGMRSAMVDTADEAELARRLECLRVERLDDAGHSVPTDQPVALAALIESFLGARTAPYPSSRETIGHRSERAYGSFVIIESGRPSAAREASRSRSQPEPLKLAATPSEEQPSLPEGAATPHSSCPDDRSVYTG